MTLTHVFQRSITRDSCSATTRLMTRLVVLLCMAAGTLLCEAEDNRASRRSDFTPASPSHFLTNAVQFRELSANDYLNECAFHLTGVVTLVDSNRSLVVLQDATGAVAVNFDLPGDSLRAIGLP